MLTYGRASFDGMAELCDKHKNANKSRMAASPGQHMSGLIIPLSACPENFSSSSGKVSQHLCITTQLSALRTSLSSYKVRGHGHICG